MGICPENLIKFPRVVDDGKVPNELTKGHTHLFLLNQEGELTEEEIDEGEEFLKELNNKRPVTP